MMSWRRLARPVGVIGILIAALTTVTGFTASNTVPVTYAGKSSQAVTNNQLASSQCAALQLTNTIVMSTGATSVSGSSGNDLILGVNQTGTVNYDGKAGDDCIVAGGGSGTKNIIDGGTGSNDVCIGPAAAKNTFKNCDLTYG
jgi:hypothetical protein